MKFTMTLHPKSLNPDQAAKAWLLRKKLKQKWADVASQVWDASGNRPRRRALENAVKRMATKKRREAIPKLKYANCGRKKLLSQTDAERVVDFVKQWRHKRFCTARYIIRELKLKVGMRTVQRTLNAAGFFWRPVPKKHKLSPGDLKKREAFFNAYGDKSAARWVANFGLVLDGVTLTLAPKPLNGKEKHAAQNIKQMWVRKGEALDNDLHCHNRYGVQLGRKVPLWGGFTGGGQFTFKFWSERPKLDKEIWAEQIEKRIKPAAAGRKVWHDNEGFLKQPDVYAANRLQMVTFPPNSGDLNPIETCWAELRKELAVREMDDLDAGRTLAVAQFRQRVSQILRYFLSWAPTRARVFYSASSPECPGACRA